MRPSVHLAAALFWVLAFATGAHAAIAHVEYVTVDIPAGWVAVAGTSPTSLRLQSPDQRIDVTVFAHPTEVTLEGDLGQLAERFLAVAKTAQERLAKGKGLGIVHRTSQVRREGERWYAHNAARLSSGLEVTAITLFERGKAVSVGAESMHATHAELEAAMQLIIASFWE